LAIDHPEINVKNIDPGIVNTPMQSEIRRNFFPDVHTFKKMAENNQLKNPVDTAKEILFDFL
jgi:NADP-dependent 3-hydroxy acid dehydrogenase YdfG